MPDETPSSSFPATRQDLSNLKQTTVDAARDLANTASAHAAKAKDQLQDLAGHAKEEGGAQLDRAKVRFGDVLGCARDFASERPLASIGTALAVGFLLGLSRRGACRN